jgi:putative DNA primase/helicase
MGNGAMCISPKTDTDLRGSICLDVRIPRELAEWNRPQWVCWRYEDRDGRSTKVPINPRTGKNASTSKPSTWGDLDSALRNVMRHRCNGVGFVFTTDDPFTGIDLDHSRNPQTGEISGRAGQILRDFR